MDFDQETAPNKIRSSEKMCLKVKANHIRGIDLLDAVNDSIRIAIGVSFLTHGFHLSKYSFQPFLRRTVVYTIFILIYKHYFSNILLSSISH